MIRGARKKTSWMPLIYAVAILFVLILGWLLKGAFTHQEVDIVDASEQENSDQVAIPKLDPPDVVYTVQDGDVLYDVFKQYEVSFQEVLALEKSSEDVFPFTNVQVGKDVWIYFSEGTSFKLAKVIYQPDLNRRIVATQIATGWVVEEQPIVYRVKDDSAQGTVDQSLYVSALNNGLDDKLILQFADIFAWDIDFARETQSGDQYQLLYQDKYDGDQFITSGKILAATYVNRGVPFNAYFFKKGDDDPGAYYDENGRSLQKSFLRAPVNFRHISSGFSMARLHPVLGKVIPHYGIDYAANFGAPIIAVGDGVIASQGWAGAYGNEVRVRHNERYTSQYGHMSAFHKGLGVGSVVKQGDIIGYVGSTGYSTGPHVHFGILDYGEFVDPASIDIPDGEPVPEEAMESFATMIKDYSDKLSNNNG